MELRVRSRVRGLLLLVGLLSSFAMTGCGAGGLAGSGQGPSAEEARDLVRTALDAWKGGTAAGLAKKEPPIRFVDPDLTRGSTLVDFKIVDGKERLLGPVTDVAVELQIKDRKKKSSSIETFYQVATQPGQAVLRNDPD